MFEPSILGATVPRDNLLIVPFEENEFTIPKLLNEFTSLYSLSYVFIQLTEKHHINIEANACHILVSKWP